MKKSRKIFGAVALSAVLAFGTAVPAFADNNNMTGADVANTTDLTNINQNNRSGSTTVQIATYSSHYSVTLPLKLPFMLDQQGGAGVAPTGYYIQNNGDQAAVEVWSVEWNLEQTANSNGSNKYYTFGANAGLASNSTKIKWSNGTTPSFGSFVVTAQSDNKTANANGNFETTATLKSGTSDTGDNASFIAIDGTTSKDGALYGFKKFNDGDWTIAKAVNPTTPTKDTITLAISGTQLSNADETIRDVARLVYTIGPKRA